MTDVDIAQLCENIFALTIIDNNAVWEVSFGQYHWRVKTIVGAVDICMLLHAMLILEMEKKRRRYNTAVRANDAVNTGTPTATTDIISTLQPASPTATTEEAMQDLVYQLANPPPPPPPPFSDDVDHDANMLEESNRGYQQQHSIQTSLDQLGSDISLIKTQLVKKKPKTTLGDVSDKVDQILQYLKINYESST